MCTFYTYSIFETQRWSGSSILTSLWNRLRKKKISSDCTGGGGGSCGALSLSNIIPYAPDVHYPNPLRKHRVLRCFFGMTQERCLPLNHQRGYRLFVRNRKYILLSFIFYKTWQPSTQYILLYVYVLFFSNLVKYTRYTECLKKRCFREPQP